MPQIHTGWSSPSQLLNIMVFWGSGSFWLRLWAPWHKDNELFEIQVLRQLQNCACYQHIVKRFCSKEPGTQRTVPQILFKLVQRGTTFRQKEPFSKLNLKFPEQCSLMETRWHFSCKRHWLLRNIHDNVWPELESPASCSSHRHSDVKASAYFQIQLLGSPGVEADTNTRAGRVIRRHQTSKQPLLHRLIICTMLIEVTSLRIAPS